MFRFVLISDLKGSVKFSHFFESVPTQLRANFEKDTVDSCLATGEKEVLFSNLYVEAIY